MTRRQFGISTRLYRSQRLRREHLAEIASHGFETIDLLAERTHVDAGNAAVVADLQQWLAEAGLELNAVSAPDAAQPVEELEAALFIARRIPVKVFAVAVGRPREAARTVERLAALASPLGVVVAVDSSSESMSPIGSLVHFVERGVEAHVGVLLDMASARARGDLMDAIEAVAEHLVAVRAPLDAVIDWSAALTTLRKVGYEGAIVFDAPPGPAKETLARARAARDKMQRWLTST